MDLAKQLPGRSYLREYWPLFVGVLLIVVGNVYYYGILGRSWHPASPPLVVALAVVLLLEVGRSVYDRL